MPSASVSFSSLVSGNSCEAFFFFTHVWIGILYLYTICILTQHQVHNGSYLKRDKNTQRIIIARFSITLYVALATEGTQSVRTNPPLILISDVYLYLALEYISVISSECFSNRHSSHSRMNKPNIEITNHKVVSIHHLLLIILIFIFIWVWKKKNHSYSNKIDTFLSTKKKR